MLTAPDETAVQDGDAPLLSIVVPVHRSQAFLRECLESVISQDFDSWEVVAVDDASPDHSGEILDAISAEDPRVRVIHLTENAGMGPARNIAMAAARGDYVMFLDSDDVFSAGTLRAIAERIEETDRPDVVVLSHARWYWWGKLARNAAHRRLVALATDPETGAPTTFTAEGNEQLFRLLQVPWNKVVRRDYLEREDLVFPPGYYEDTFWTYKVLLLAGSIAALPRVCVHYRQRRGGSILSSTSERHLEVFDQWERIFDFLEGRPELSRWKDVVAGRMADHYRTVLHTGRLPESVRTEFFHRAAAHLSRYGIGSEAEHWQRKVQYQLIRYNLWLLFRILNRLNRSQRRFRGTLRRQVRKNLRSLRRRRSKLRLMRYRRQLREPIDPDLAVFSAYWDRGYQCNPRAIYEAMQKVAPQMRGVWVVRPDKQATVPEGVEVVAPSSDAYWAVMARAKYFVNNVNFHDAVVKRPGQVHLETQHGTPLKHMGIDLMQHPAASAGMVFRHLLRRTDRWDYNLSSNTYSTLIWEKAFPGTWRSLEAGYPRNDVLVNATAEDIARARAEIGIPADKVALLYAPTYRDYRKHFELHVDLERFVSEIGDDVVVLVRAHYFYKWLPALDKLAEAGRIINVSRHPEVERLMLASDLLVTDYSSIMFDFANLRRPIISFVDDWETYRDVRGVYFDLPDAPPGVVARSQEDLTRAVVDRSYEGPLAWQNLDRFRSRFCEYDDGRAAERVARTVFLEETFPAPTPISDRTAPPRPCEVRDTLVLFTIPDPDDESDPTTDAPVPVTATAVGARSSAEAEMADATS